MPTLKSKENPKPSRANPARNASYHHIPKREQLDGDNPIYLIEQAQ
jgi:hypothetical protein